MDDTTNNDLGSAAARSGIVVSGVVGANPLCAVSVTTIINVEKQLALSSLGFKTSLWK